MTGVHEASGGFPGDEFCFQFVPVRPDTQVVNLFTNDADSVIIRQRFRLFFNMFRCCRIPSIRQGRLYRRRNPV